MIRHARASMSSFRSSHGNLLGLDGPARRGEERGRGHAARRRHRGAQPAAPGMSPRSHTAVRLSFKYAGPDCAHVDAEAEAEERLRVPKEARPLGCGSRRSDWRWRRCWAEHLAEQKAAFGEERRRPLKELHEQSSVWTTRLAAGGERTERQGAAGAAASAARSQLAKVDAWRRP